MTQTLFFILWYCIHSLL